MDRQSRRAIGNSTPQPLAILAGLPSPTHTAAVVALQAAFPTWKVIATAFPKPIGRAYADRGAILDLLREVCAFAEAETDKQPPRPGRLVLFYVQEAGFEQLLDAFGFSVVAVPLNAQDWHWPHGKHWRSDIDVVLKLLMDGVQSAGTNGLLEIKERLETPATDEALLLPPRNFMVDGQTSLFARFEALHRANALSDADFAELTIETFTAQNLKTFFVRTHGVRGDFRVDHRGLVFATSPRGQHGYPRVQNISGTKALGDFRPLLEGIFRFGTPLRVGFQHDVQWPNDRELKGVSFLDVDTPVVISSTHANVYANDVVK
jgi:hypothetical protein